jgi:hypothetical protein
LTTGDLFDAYAGGTPARIPSIAGSDTKVGNVVSIQADAGGGGATEVLMLGTFPSISQTRHCQSAARRSWRKRRSGAVPASSSARRYAERAARTSPECFELAYRGGEHRTVRTTVISDKAPERAQPGRAPLARPTAIARCRAMTGEGVSAGSWSYSPTIWAQSIAAWVVARAWQAAIAKRACERRRDRGGALSVQRVEIDHMQSVACDINDYKALQVIVRSSAPRTTTS